MAAQRGYLYDVVLSTAGVPVSGISVQINQHSGGAATLYTTEGGGTTTGNPMTTGVDGSFACWLPEGSYDVVLSGSGYTTQTIYKEVLKASNEPGPLLTATGDLPYASSANALARLAVGSAGQVLTVAGGVPTWAASAGTVTATTVSGLGAAVDGKVGMLRLGASPYEFVRVTYDSTYAKWVSDPLESSVVLAIPPVNSVSNAFYTFTAGSGSAWAFGSLTQANFAARVTAGLTPQIRQVCTYQLATVAGTPNVSFLIRAWHTTNNPLAAPDGVEFGSPAYTSGNLLAAGIGWIGYDSGWQAMTLPGTAKDILDLAVEFVNSTGNSQNMAIKGFKLMIRWVA